MRSRRFTLKDKTIISLEQVSVVEGSNNTYKFGLNGKGWIARYIAPSNPYEDGSYHSEKFSGNAMGATLRETIGRLRLSLAKHNNPSVKKVANRISGEEPSIEQIRKAVTFGINYGMGPYRGRKALEMLKGTTK